MSPLTGRAGLVGDIALGVGGAIVGGYIGGLLLRRDLMVSGFNLESVAVARVAAVPPLIAVSRLFSAPRGTVTR
jgi:uncharacterized membrane protein YeaQ/YmgE (transglycosylase-associated protein family)